MGVEALNQFGSSLKAFFGLVLIISSALIGVHALDRSFLANAGLAVLLFGGLFVFAYYSLSGYMDEQDLRKEV